jgi:cation transport protein ChaC
MTDQDAWVFAYGSLLWDPGFTPAEAVRARLDGYRRRFCMWSFHYRGTEESPGLVLALEQEEGASCEALALRPDPKEAEAVIAAIRRRELVSDAYEERQVTVRLEDGREVGAVAFVVRPGHRQHACVDAETQARTIARARGERGPNLDYLVNTAAALRRQGIRDPEIEALDARARALAADSVPGAT